MSQTRSVRVESIPNKSFQPYRHLWHLKQLPNKIINNVMVHRRQGVRKAPGDTFLHLQTRQRHFLKFGVPPTLQY